MCLTIRTPCMWSASQSLQLFPVRMPAVGTCWPETVVWSLRVLIKMICGRCEPPLQPAPPNVKEVLTSIIEACVEPGAEVQGVLAVATG